MLLFVLLSSAIFVDLIGMGFVCGCAALYGHDVLGAHCGEILLGMLLVGFLVIMSIDPNGTGRHLYCFLFQRVATLMQLVWARRSLLVGALSYCCTAKNHLDRSRSL